MVRNSCSKGNIRYKSTLAFLVLDVENTRHAFYKTSDCAEKRDAKNRVAEKAETQVGESTIRSVRPLNDPYGSNDLFFFQTNERFLSLSNKMQYTIHKVCMSVNSTLRSVRALKIERIVKPSAPLTFIKTTSFFYVSLMRRNI